MRRILYTLIACLLAAGTMTAQDAQTAFRFTLEDCLNYAMNNNYNRQISKLNENINEEVYKQSKMERLPNVSASLSEGYANSKTTPDSWTGNYNVNAGVTLFQGGAISNAIEQSKLTLEQSSYQTVQFENELTIKILQSFLAVVGNEELIKYQESVVAASEEQVKQGKEQFRAGTMLESDYLLLEAQFASDKNNISDTRIARENSLLTLKNLLSMPSSNNLEIIYPDTAAVDEMSIIPSLDYVLENAVATLPDIKISQYNVDIAKMSVKLSKSGYFPSLSLNGSVGTGHRNYSNFGTQLSDALNEQIGLTLSVPLYNNNRTKSKVAQSRIALQQAEFSQKQTQLDVLQNVSVEYQDVMSSYNSFLTTDIRQNAYLKSFEAYRAKFNAGAITAVDLLQQQNNYISALNDFIQSKYGFMLKRKILDVYMGVPVKM